MDCRGIRPPRFNTPSLPHSITPTVISGSCHCSKQLIAKQCETTMELVSVVWLSGRCRCSIQLSVFRPLPDYPRFSVGESLTVRDRRNSFAGWAGSRVWTASHLSRQNCRADTFCPEPADVRVVLLRPVLHRAPNAAIHRCTAGRSEGAGFHIGGSGWKERCAERLAWYPEYPRRSHDLLSGLLVNVM